MFQQENVHTYIYTVRNRLNEYLQMKFNLFCHILSITIVLTVGGPDRALMGPQN